MNENAPEELPTEQPNKHRAARADDGSGASMVRIGAWTFAVLGLLAYLSFGWIDAVWYRYNTFTQRLSREVDERDIVNVWMSWLDNLPESSGDWALSALFVGSLAVVIASMIVGTWLLLVTPGDLHPRVFRSRG